MTAVTISPTFGKNERPSNGLEAIAGQLIKDQLGRHFVVGVVQFCGASVPGPNEPLVPRVKFLAIEPLSGEDAKVLEQILDRARQVRGLGIVNDIPAAGGDLPGQEAFDFEGLGEEPVDTNASGEPVPPASAAEELAERAEAKASGGKSVPAATFTGGSGAA